MEKDKEASLLKRTISRDQPIIERTKSSDQSSAVGAGMKGIGMGEKEVRGTEEAIEGVKERLKGAKDAATGMPENGVSQGDRKALEEENAPIVSGARST